MTPLCDAGSRNGLCRGERSHGAGGKPASFQNLSGAPDTTTNMERPSAAVVHSTIPVLLFRLLPRLSADTPIVTWSVSELPHLDAADAHILDGTSPWPASISLAPGS
jgi:hypothetical protein